MATIEVYSVRVESRSQDKINVIFEKYKAKALVLPHQESHNNGRSSICFELSKDEFNSLYNLCSQDDELQLISFKSHQPHAQDILQYLGNKTKDDLLDVNLLNNIDDFSSYTSLEELEYLLTAINEEFPRITKIFEAENKTFEKRKTLMLQIGAPCSNTKESIIIVGGMHADEWVATESLLYFAYAMCSSYVNSDSIHFKNLEFSSEGVKSFLEKYNIVLVPCLNPDGRAYTHNPNGLVTWRKNRSEEHLNIEVDEISKEIGVDINRNFNIAWDLKLFGENMVSSSNEPKEHDYQGEEATSESETKNLVNIFDRMVNCRVYIDVHASGDDILYPWAIDTNQFYDKDMNYDNNEYKGKRGGKGGYAEYMIREDHMEHLYFAHAMNEAIALSGAKRYTVSEASELYGVGISGVSPDYAYSRHLKTDLQLNKILGFTLECGDNELGNIYSDKRPKPEQVKKIVKETCSALIGACKALQKEGSST